MRLLVTRPLPDGERTAATLRAQGHDVLLAPLMKVKPVAADLSGSWSVVIITSANALRALSSAQIAQLRALPLFAVGMRSAEAAHAAGFRDVRASRGTAVDLVRLVAERYANQTVSHLYLAGEDHAADIEGELGKRGVPVRTVVVYRNVTTGFPPELIAALERRSIDAVLHFSRRSAENYLAGAKDTGLMAAALLPRQLCISSQVAEPVSAAGARAVEIAKRPDEAALIDLLQGAEG